MGRQQLKQLLLTYFVSTVILHLSHGVTHEILNTICSQTQNQEICVQMLESDSRTGSADLPELSLISINLTSKQANKNYDVFRKFKDHTTDPALRNPYQKCVNIYGVIKLKLIGAYNLARQQRYEEINQMGKSRDWAYSCENGIPSNNNATAGISEDMILSCETSASVVFFIASSVS